MGTSAPCQARAARARPSGGHVGGGGESGGSGAQAGAGGAEAVAEAWPSFWGMSVLMILNGDFSIV